MRSGRMTAPSAVWTQHVERKRSVLDLGEVEARMTARRLLRQAYLADVDVLAHEICARVRRGEFDSTIWTIGPTIDGVILRHPRVTEMSLALETIAYSENRSAIETDFLRGWSIEHDGPWASFTLPVDPESGEPCEITMPAWSAISYHAFSRDVNERVYALLGDTPERFVASIIGIDWD